MAQQKASFKKWWKNITGNKAAKVGLFNVDLVDSIIYAGVPVLKTVEGRLRTQGYIPTIVSKCGRFLKENGLKTRGIFRVSGSAKRISDLQALFDTPPLYGSQLDWSPYTIHDASSVLRRYLNSLPDPVITLEYYEKFRDVHRTIADDKEKIAAYQDLMAKLPPPHSCLLMYLLDFLAVFAHHNDENLMTSKNLASVFQPGILSHPDHAMSPGDYMISASVVEFLIDNQSSFALPTPNFDEEDDEGATFGVAHSASHSTFDSGSSAPILPTLALTEGYEDHERIRQLMSTTPANGTWTSDGMGEESLERSKTTTGVGMRRRLSLHKALGVQSSLPGQRPTRSKSTSSSASSQQGQPGMFSSNLLARRRSSRVSKTQSVYSTKGLEADDVFAVDATFAENDAAAQDTSLSSLSPKRLSVRRTQTLPHLPQSLDANEAEDAANGSKHIVAREPSIIFETIDLQFPLPAVLGSTIQPGYAPSTTPTDAVSKHVTTQDQPPTAIHPFDRPAKPAADWSARGRFATLEPTVHVHYPDPPLPQPRDLSAGHPQTLARNEPPHQLVSATGVNAFNDPVLRKGSSAPRGANKPPHRKDGQIQRTKSTPAGLIKPSNSPPLKDGNDGHTHHSTGHSIFKGWLTGRHKDKSNKENEGGAGSKEEKKQETAASEKQRKYRSQDISSTFPSDESHHGGGTQSRRDSGRGGGGGGGGGGNFWHGGFLGREPIQEDTIVGHDDSRKHSGSPPQRPRPPPPEGSLLDILGPPQRTGYNSSHSESTTPSDPRSTSPVSHSRLQEPPSIPSPNSHSPSPPSSVRSKSKSRSNSLVGHHHDHQHHSYNQRSRHGTRLPSHGSSTSLNSYGSGMIPASVGGTASDQPALPAQAVPRRGEPPATPLSSGLYLSGQSSGSSLSLSQHDPAKTSSQGSDPTSSFNVPTNPIPTPAKSRDRKASMHYPSTLGSSSPANRSRSSSFRTASPSRLQQSPSGSPRVTPASLPAAPQSPPPPIPLSRPESGRGTPDNGRPSGRPQPPVRRGTAPSIQHGHHHHDAPHLHRHSPLAEGGEDGIKSRQRSGSVSGMRPLGHPLSSARSKSRERPRDVKHEREKEREREEEEFRLARTKSVIGGSHPAAQPGDPPGFF